MKEITTDKAPAAIGPYCQAITSGSLVFLSGQIPLDPATGEIVAGDVSKQARQVLDNIDAVLKAAALTRSSIIKATIYTTELSEFSAINDVYAEFLGDHRPARSTVGVAELPKGAKVEIEVIAVRR
jgi:2-iminobutanoate/2-iminopropanoate deaminase